MGTLWTPVGYHRVRSRTILLLEDEPLIRGATAEILVESGHTVLQAGNAAEALARLNERADIDVFVADVNLRGSVSGCEVGKLAKLARPDLRLIMTSGTEPASLPPNSMFLPKPYRPTEICKVVGD